jgi:hypothetical protein
MVKSSHLWVTADKTKATSIIKGMGPINFLKNLFKGDSSSSSI